METDKTATDSPPRKWVSVSYESQNKLWPSEGRHILGQFDEDTIVVYQAFNKEIASYAVANKKFTGCPVYSTTRMTWIKTNFLWMMYRCNWAQKGKKSVLAIWLKRDAFENLLSMAVASSADHNKEEEWNKQIAQQKTEKDTPTVRLQWDPDHKPNGKKHPLRRAIQLGLKNVESFRNGDDIVDIQDITSFVKSQRKHVTAKAWGKLMVAKEEVYVVKNEDIRDRIQLAESSYVASDDDE